MSPPTRTTGRVKKAKVIFDPSDIPQPETENPRRRSARQSNASLRSRDVPSSTSRNESRFMLPIDLTEHLLNNKEATLTRENWAWAFVGNKCVVCEKPDTANPKNKLISCLGCKKQTHVYCLSWHIEDVKLLRANYKCVDCRSCHMCDAFYVSQSRSDNVVTCSKCIKTYHLTCHVPNVQLHEKLQRNWKCNKCQQFLFDSVLFGAICLDTLYRIIGVVPDGTNSARQSEPSSTSESTDLSALNQNASISDVTSTSEYVATTSTNVQGNPLLPMQMPDVKNWNNNQIADFFYAYFPKDYQIFNELKIDGKSLLALKRDDIIGKFSPKLGTSLRMYSLILKLQTGINDDTLGWV